MYRVAILFKSKYELIFLAQHSTLRCSEFISFVINIYILFHSNFIYYIGVFVYFLFLIWICEKEINRMTHCCFCCLAWQVVQRIGRNSFKLHSTIRNACRPLHQQHWIHQNSIDITPTNTNTCSKNFVLRMGSFVCLFKYTFIVYRTVNVNAKMVNVAQFIYIQYKIRTYQLGLPRNCLSIYFPHIYV